MTGIYKVMVQSIFILVVFSVIGYILSKVKLIKCEHSQILSQLCIYVFLPCNVFNTFATGFTRTYIKEKYTLLLISSIVVLCLACVAYFTGKLFSKEPYERRIFEYTLTAPNYGYMGYALAISVLGTVGELDFMLFSLPMSVYVYGYAFSILTKRPISLKKCLNPAIVSMVLGMIAGLIRIPLPSVVSIVLEQAGGCMAPISMLLFGVVLSEYSIKAILSEKRLYIAVGLRLLVIPAGVGLMLLPFVKTEVLRVAVLFYALPCGLNTVVFPKLMGENCSIGAGLALISTILSCVSIPFLFWCFQII